MHRIAIACAVLAASAPAGAQVPPPTPPLGTPAPAPAPPATPGTPAAPPSVPPAAPPPSGNTAGSPDAAGPTNAAPAASAVPATSPAPAASTGSEQRDRVIAEEHCAAHDPRCDWLATLSTLERASVTRALAARGYVIDQAPWGKVIGSIRVYNEEVFAEPQPLLQFFNHFHFLTTESRIRAESVIHPGEVWDQPRVEETARRLRDPLYTSVAAVLPIATAEPGKVDILIVTRDIWSLRLNTVYTFQEGKLTNLSASLSENNFLGKRDVVFAGIVMDQGAIAVGPGYIDKNLLGEHLLLQAQVNDILTRDDLLDHGKLHSEGTTSSISLSRPLWSLASEWAAGISFSHRFAIDRQFLGTELRAFQFTDPETGQTDLFGREYKMRFWAVTAFVTRQWGTDLKQQLSLGHSVSSQRPQPLDDFPGDEAARAAFIADVLPRSEVDSSPFIEYSFFTPRYRTLRNVSTFALAEDLRTGPDLDVQLAFGLKALGSDFNFEKLSSAVGWTIPITRDGFVRVAAGLGGRYVDGRFIDETATWSIRAAAPPIGDSVRLMAQTSLSTRWNDTQNQFFAIGSDTGLRGFAINEFTGQRYFNLQVEARTLPYPWWVLRLGAVAFYDLGGAADSLALMTLHQDAGLGLRMLIPQTSAQLVTFDFAVPFDGPDRGAVRFLAGVGSQF